MDLCSWWPWPLTTVIFINLCSNTYVYVNHLLCLIYIVRNSGLRCLVYKAVLASGSLRATILLPFWCSGLLVGQPSRSLTYIATIANPISLPFVSTAAWRQSDVPLREPGYTVVKTYNLRVVSTVRAVRIKWWGGIICLLNTVVGPGVVPWIRLLAHEILWASCHSTNRWAHPALPFKRIDSWAIPCKLVIEAPPT